MLALALALELAAQVFTVNTVLSSSVTVAASKVVVPVVLVIVKVRSGSVTASRLVVVVTMVLDISYVVLGPPYPVSRR